jgi:hypothetical protein
MCGKFGNRDIAATALATNLDAVGRYRCTDLAPAWLPECDATTRRARRAHLVCSKLPRAAHPSIANKSGLDVLQKHNNLRADWILKP